MGVSTAWDCVEEGGGGGGATVLPDSDEVEDGTEDGGYGHVVEIGSLCSRRKVLS